MAEDSSVQTRGLASGHKNVMLSDQWAVITQELSCGLQDERQEQKNGAKGTKKGESS